MYGVPMQTLRDRVIGNVDPMNDSYGPETVLSNEEAEQLEEHVEIMA